jgi:hypothetical protein
MSAGNPYATTPKTYLDLALKPVEINGRGHNEKVRRCNNQKPILLAMTAR